MKSSLASLSLVVISTMVACSSSPGLTGTGGQGGGEAGGAGGHPADAGDDTLTTLDAGAAFASVQSIFATKCVRCHDPANPVIPETITFVALALTPDATYGALVGQPAHESCGGTLVVPGDTAASYLYHKIADATPCEGMRMPHQGMILTPPLSDGEIATVGTWINAGAPR
jgi:cytochrome c553